MAIQNVKWKDGISRFYKGIDPVEVYSELRSLGETYTAEDVVTMAKDENSELHKCFEWDDTVAAEKYRLTQARTLIANLVVTVEREEKEPTEFRLYQSNGRTKGFSQNTVIARDVDRYSELLERAMAELDAFRKRYANIVELENVIAEIEALIG